MTVQEAIEIIKYAYAFNSENSPLTKALDVAIEGLEEVEQYRALGTAEELKEAREKQPKTDWIPCEERLPSEHNQYLVSLEGYCKPMIAYFSTENKKWYWYNSTAEMRYVLAWQPLPQPYKKEGAENEM